jgi:hypothetical protein
MENPETVQFLRTIHHRAVFGQTFECTNPEEHTQQKNMRTENQGGIKDDFRNWERVPIPKW